MQNAVRRLAAAAVVVIVVVIIVVIATTATRVNTTTRTQRARATPMLVHMHRPVSAQHHATRPELGTCGSSTSNRGGSRGSGSHPRLGGTRRGDAWRQHGRRTTRGRRVVRGPGVVVAVVGAGRQGSKRR